MKNVTLIAWAIIITCTVTAFKYSNWNGQIVNKHSCQTTSEIEPPFLSYMLSPLSKNTISKERMHTAKTISDIIPEYGIQEDLKNNIISLRDVKIKIEEESSHCSKYRHEKGNGNILTKEQISLLRSTDYSSNFVIEGYIVDNNVIKDANLDRYFNYNMSVVPENQASYKDGNDGFIDFLKTECQATIMKVQRGNLKSGTINFTVNKNGTISDVDFISTCGYPSIDKRMMDLMNQLPGVWNVATNAKGEKVNQTLVFTYGQSGC